MADGVTRLGTDELVTGQTGQTSGLCTLCLFWPSLPSPLRRLLSFELRDPLTAWDSCSLSTQPSRAPPQSPAPALVSARYRRSTALQTTPDLSDTVQNAALAKSRRRRRTRRRANQELNQEAGAYRTAWMVMNF
ncbi:uncharacterized protein TrAFT101_008959 [Trichoderma asperellum]|uniref:uncharacterized protein n=1 Tax=Trichoderma asperellum TaxID=101201 RepID=UPI0033240EF6|nr:hypothetical protein TrAFT101_008959 [Trichoderma asperellum]